MAISKADFNNINITPTASKAIKWNASANGFETGDIDGSMVLLSTQTADSSGNITFDSEINSTYKEYIVKFINIHAETDNVIFQVNFRDGGTDYDATKTTTAFFAVHNEADNDAKVEYRTDFDLAQSTGVQKISIEVGNGNDESISGELTLFNPSSTTFVKHFLTRAQHHSHHDYSQDSYRAGYCNTTAAIDGIQFTMSSGDIDSGIFKLYGIT